MRSDSAFGALLVLPQGGSETTKTTTDQPQSDHKATTNRPQTIQEPCLKPRPTAPAPGLTRSTNAPPFARRPPPVAHLSIWLGLGLGLLGVASGMVPGWFCGGFVVALWSLCGWFVVSKPPWARTSNAPKQGVRTACVLATLRSREILPSSVRCLF